MNIFTLLDPEASEGVPNRHDGCSCCYLFRKMPEDFVNTQRKVTKIRIHICDIIPDRSTVLDSSY